MIDKLLPPAAWLSVLLCLSSCSGVAGDVQAGRNALQTRQADAAIGYLMRAAAVNPAYKTPSRIREGVLTLLGRAYLATGKDIEARRSLEQAVGLDADDYLAQLYLGVALLKTGERERGRSEVEKGLRGIDATLEQIAADRVSGFFWDPGMQIRNDIRNTLAGRLDDDALASAGQRIGAELDEEIDNARRDESRSRGGSGGGDGS